jgi:hypothetical protein
MNCPYSAIVDDVGVVRRLTDQLIGARKRWCLENEQWLVWWLENPGPKRR